MQPRRPLAVVFFRTEAGNEPTREWLKFEVMKKRIHRGSDLRDFLREEGILEEVEAAAWKAALTLQLQRLLKERSMTKSEMAVRMKTSRAAVDRLLDAANNAVTFTTLGKAPRALGRRVKIELV